MTDQLRITKVKDYGDGMLGVVDMPLYGGPPEDPAREQHIARLFFGKAALADYERAIDLLGFALDHAAQPEPITINGEACPVVMVRRTANGRLVGFGSVGDPAATRLLHQVAGS